MQKTKRSCRTWAPMASGLVAALAAAGCDGSGAGDAAPASNTGPADEGSLFYEIRADAGGDILVSLALPRRNPREPAILFSRAAALNIASQVREVECDGASVERSDAGQWLLPDACAQARWRVEPLRFKDAEAGPADQQTFEMESGWRLVSGPSSILRLQGAAGTPASVRLIPPEGPTTTHALPPLSKPPAFYVLGDAPQRRFDYGGGALLYVGDDLGAVTAYVNPDLHARAIGYFSEMLRLRPEPQSAPPLQVVWFGVPRERHVISGAAGADTLLANYILPAEGPDPTEFYRPFVLVLHEQFHQIQSRAEDLAQQPEWIGESLAQYYALKAARRVFPENDAIQSIYRQYVETPAPIERGLLDVQRQISDEGDYTHYSLFYSQGVHFWNGVDKAIAAASEGRRSLDDVLLDVRVVPFPEPAQLPDGVKAALTPADENEIDALAERYLLGEAKE